MTSSAEPTILPRFVFNGTYSGSATAVGTSCKLTSFLLNCRYRITGDGEDVGDPRHPATICKECISQHASIGINEGHLYVKCPFPDCGRSLQTLELRELVPTDVYEKLVSGIKEMESGKASLSSFDVPEGLQLRLCPACHARIEKNEGVGNALRYQHITLFDVVGLILTV